MSPLERTAHDDTAGRPIVPLPASVSQSAAERKLDLMDFLEGDMTPPPPRSPFPFSSLLRNGFPLSRQQRMSLFALSLCLLAGFAAAALVKPDRRGFGTHQQFGLPPCTFQWLFGIPCPGCGGTTCFAHFVRGQWLAAARVNIAAFALAILCAAFIPWSWASAWRGRLLGVREPTSTLLAAAITVAAAAFVQWGVRLLPFH